MFLSQKFKSNYLNAPMACGNQRHSRHPSTFLSFPGSLCPVGASGPAFLTYPEEAQPGPHLTDTAAPSSLPKQTHFVNFTGVFTALSGEAVSARPAPAASSAPPRLRFPMELQVLLPHPRQLRESL